MPIYEYTCKSCKARFEQLVRNMSEQTEAKCPECGSTATVRSLSVFAVAADGAKSSSSNAPTCGRCGGPPGSCSA